MNLKNINLYSLERLFKLLEKPLNKKRRVLIVRHGQSLGNIQNIIYGAKDYPLTTFGTLQARIFSPLFRKYLHLFDCFATSNLMRAMETYKGCMYLVNNQDLHTNLELKQFAKMPEDYPASKNFNNSMHCSLNNDLVEVDFFPGLNKDIDLSKYDSTVLESLLVNPNSFDKKLAPKGLIYLPLYTPILHKS